MTHGDRHRHTMEMAKWWLDGDKSAVYKLFQVLVPRFKDSTRSYTRLMASPMQRERFPHDRLAGHRAVLELRGNPFPPLEYPNSRLAFISVFESFNCCPSMYAYDSLLPRSGRTGITCTTCSLRRPRSRRGGRRRCSRRRRRRDCSVMYHVCKERTSDKRRIHAGISFFLSPNLSLLKVS